MADLEIDVRGLEPPEPLEHTLAALVGLRPGQCLRLLIHREPFPLYGMLADMGFVHRTEPQADGSFLVLIKAPGDPHRCKPA